MLRLQEKKTLTTINKKMNNITKYGTVGWPLADSLIQYLNSKDPDRHPYQNEKSDPDPNQNVLDPQHGLKDLSTKHSVQNAEYCPG